MDKRTDSFGLPLPPRKQELRKPLLWLDSKGLDLGHELFLINSSDEILDSVSASSRGFHTFWDDVITVASEFCEYKNIEPVGAVKIDEFDGYSDLDYVI